jgi:voltage-gated potassium channel Kch
MCLPRALPYAGLLLLKETISRLVFIVAEERTFYQTLPTLLFGLNCKRDNSHPATFRYIMVMSKHKKESNSLTRYEITIIDDDDDIESTYGVHSSSQSIHSTHSARPRAKSVASTKLKEGGLDEIIPIQHTQSRDQKVEGHYTVDEPGNYVLVFGKSYEWRN